MAYGDKTSMERLSTRIKERLDKLGISEREASRRAGFSPGYVGDVIHGRSKEPALPRVIKLASALECDSGWLIGNQEAVAPQEERSFAPQRMMGSQRLIDLYSSPSLSDDLWVPMSQKAVDKVPVIPPLLNVDDAYAWSICTPHMEPRYYMGEIIYLHPGLTPRPGDFVLAKNKNGYVGVARYLRMAEGSVTFQYLKGNQQCDVPVSEIAFMHRIMGSAG